MNLPTPHHKTQPPGHLPIPDTPNHLESGETPLDKATACAVLNALAASQNADGGFGNFQKGVKTPSTPLKTHAATEIILQSGIKNRQHQLATHPVLIGITDYLKTYPPLSAGHYKTTYAADSNRSSAPWWKKTKPASPAGYHPLAALTGFVLAFMPKHDPVYERSRLMAGHLIRSFLEENLPLHANIISSMQRLIEHLNANHIRVPDSPSLYNLKIRQQTALLSAKEKPDTCH